MRISDWSSDVCSSDLRAALVVLDRGFLDALEATDAGADRHADVFRVGGDVEHRVLDGHYRGGHAVVDEGIHLLDVLRRDPLGGIEAPQLPRGAGGQGRCCEMRRRADAGAVVEVAGPATPQAV